MALGKSDPGREPLQIVELDQDLCGRLYGTSPCTAVVGVTGAEKCYNTRKTCQVVSAYWPTSRATLRFVRPQVGPLLSLDVPASSALPSWDPTHGLTYTTDQALAPLPFLVSVSAAPTQVNVGGRAGRTQPLGKRASVTVVLQDAPHSDLQVDPYLPERSWDPLARATFWAKWLARNPYYSGRPLRVYTGYRGQTLAEMDVQHYVLDKIQGPDASGRVTIRALDVLRLADDDVAQAPPLSTGTASTTIYAADTTIVATGTASGDYPAGNGAIRIDDEVIRYGSAAFSGGTTTFYFCARGQEGTAAAQHEVDALVQACLDVSSQAWEAVRDILRDYTAIPDTYVDAAAWQAEAEKWNGNYQVARVITSPAGVATLIGELCQQGSFFIWWDAAAQQIRLRCVRPPLPTEVVSLSEEYNLIQGKTKETVRPEERLTEVWVSWGLRTALDDANKRSSYLFTEARVDLEAEGVDQYGGRKVYEILSPWLVGGAQVSPLSYRLLAASRDTPGYMTVELDAKDSDIVQVGTIVDLTWRGFVDENGLPETRRFIVISVTPVEAGTTFRVELQPSQFTSRYAYIMDDASGAYSSYTEATRPVLSAFLAAPSGAGPAQDFPDNSGPYVFV